MIPFTQKQMVSWGGQQVYDDAEALAKRGGVIRADYRHPVIEGDVARPTGPIHTSLEILPNGMVKSNCPCYDNRQLHLICPHVIALAIVVYRRMTDPERARRYIEERRRAKRIAEQSQSQWLRRMPDGEPCRVEVRLPAEFVAQFRKGRVEVDCALLSAADGRTIPTEPPPSGFAARLGNADENLCCVLEDIAEGHFPSHLSVGCEDFLNILDVCHGRALPVYGGGLLTVHGEAVPTRLQVDLDHETGELLLYAQTDLPVLRPGEFPDHLVAGRRGWVVGCGHAWPMKHILPLPYHPIYADPIAIPRMDSLRFMRSELPKLAKLMPVEGGEVTEDLFSSDRAKPKFRLHVRGSLASLAATLEADYGGKKFIARAPGDPDEVVAPDPEDFLHFFTRNVPAETEALDLLRRHGLSGDRGDSITPIAGVRELRNFLGGGMPALKRDGWDIDFTGSIAEFVENAPVITPVVNIVEGHDKRWFDVSIDFESAKGAKVSQSQVQRAIQMNESFIEQPDGTCLLLDRDAVLAARAVFRDCDSQATDVRGRFRISSVHAPYVRAAITAIDGVDIEEPPDWRARAARQNRDMRLAPVPLEGGLEDVLRPYQKDGVYWLRFLEEGGFGGILADEMGLGKTLQTLAWLRLERIDEEARKMPSLVVCPTSLVENWAREAAKFTPDRRVVVIAGPHREKLWEKVADCDLAIISYALLRRDIESCLGVEFAAVVLDEAHNIKNRATQNAIAAKQIRARNKLVLTGTPIENSVSDLWSIMDFLMPGYLGEYKAFHDGYEVPLEVGGDDAEEVQKRLRRKLHPFLLRRVKRDVAKDLPDKIVKTSFCTLTEDQQRVYNQVLAETRAKIKGMVAQRGFEGCRMEILAMLLRLRQICCHLDLLPEDMRPKDAEAPSAKLEQFTELLDEAVRGGHRLLVFSQFTSMLAILRRTLEERGDKFCYLDGSTKNRMDEVQRYNRNRDIPVFLISLKAGGTGLTLTGADMVVHFDPWWNPAVEDQATDRAHRIGQKRTVYSVKMIAEQTIEEKVLAMQQKKQALIRATIGTTDDAMLKSLTWSDVQELLA